MKPFLSLQVNFQSPLRVPVFPVGKVPVECYDEERGKWNDRTTIPVDKIFFRENESASGLYFWLEFCSVRLFHPSSS